MVSEDHVPTRKIGDQNLQRPSWNLHIIQILNNKRVVNSVKCLGEIYECHDNSMRFIFVNSGMDEVQESDQVVRDGGSFQTPTI